jgi:hypothetical protein
MILLFLDSSVVLAHLVQQHQRVLGRLRKDVVAYNLECVVSNSVVEECQTKVQGLKDLLGQLLAEVIKDKIARQRGIDNRLLEDPVDHRDILAVERAFFELTPAYIRNNVPGRFGVSPFFDLKTVETLIVEFLDAEMLSGKKPSLTETLVGLTALILKLFADINVGFDSAIRIKHELARPIAMTPDQTEVSALIRTGLSLDDATHIASAMKVRKNGVCTNCLFVTVDSRTILVHQVSILNAFNIWCCDPLYAAHHAQGIK